MESQRRNQLMQQFYIECLEPSFGRFESELEPLDVFLKALDIDEGLYQLHVIVLMSETGIMMSGCSFELYRTSQCGLLTYIVVKEEYRKSGLAKIMVQHVLKQLKEDTLGRLRGLFLETNSDKAQNDVMHPATRRAVLGRLGFRCLNQLNYVQPPLSATKPKCYDLILAIHESFYKDGEGANSRIVLSWLREFYHVLMGDVSESDSDLAQQSAILTLVENIQ